MHGRPREPKKPDDEVSIAHARKLQNLQAQMLNNHHNKIYTKEALDLCAELLGKNPEVYTAWNYRKLAVDHNLRSETDQDCIKAILDQELRLIEIALRRNFKSYGAWHHRKWILSKGFSSIDHEFKLLDKFLKADPRNFHGWNYRRFVASLQERSDEQELEFTTDKINDNFSNYSSWHYRSVLLSRLLQQKAPGFFPREKILSEEYELVHQAIFTDPDDQSAWFYHLWLLDQTATSVSPRLISSWPPHQSNLTMPTDIDVDNSTWAILHGDVLPLILYFNQDVEGVNSSTILVKIMPDNRETLVWRPLSTKSKRAKIWVAYLKISGLQSDASSYAIQITVGSSPGIISAFGSQYNCPSHFEFRLNLGLTVSGNNKGGLNGERFTWNDFVLLEEKCIEEFHSLVASFNKLIVTSDSEPIVSSWSVDTLENEITLFRELLAVVDCKIGKLSLARLLMAHDEILSNGRESLHNRCHTEEILELFSDLMKSDMVHSRYYREQHSLMIMEKVTSDRKSLANHCWYRSSAEGLHHDICLRLNNLSLSRIGFIERLLWVQILNLSDNELQSIEGLEAMQLLSCLNLSKNRLRSFTALDPLRSIPTLKVLDISYNEIGMHSTDTTRYLCSSPISHDTESNGTSEFFTENNELAYKWEGMFLFKDLRLMQLDIMGNPEIDYNFKKLVIKILPTLKWLDGECVR